MHKKMIFMILLWASLGYNNSALAVDIRHDEICRNTPKVERELIHKRTAMLSLGFLQAMNPTRVGQDGDYRELEEALERLMEELRELKGDARQRILEDLLPLIREKIDEIRRRLRDFRREDTESEPIKT